MRYPSKPENLDETGCIKSYNELAQEFNQQLKDRINTLRIKLEHSLLVFVDVYSAKYSLISNAKQTGE